MKCVCCGQEIPANAKICPECGKSPVGGEQRTDLSKAVGDAAKEVGNKLKGAAQYVAKSAGTLTAKISNTTNNEGGSNRTRNWISLGIVVAAVIVLVFVMIGLFGSSSDDNENYALIAKSGNTLYLIDGDEVKIIAKDVQDEIFESDLLNTALDTVLSWVNIERASNICTPDGRRFYCINKNLEIVMTDDKHDQEVIAEDVLPYSMNLEGNALWYKTLDGGKTKLWCYTSGEPNEITKLDRITTSYKGLPDGKTAYYQEDDDLYINVNGDDEKIARDARLLELSHDHKKALILADEEELIIYNGRRDVDVCDDVKHYLFDPKSCDTLVLDTDDKLLYIPYGKDAIEIDDDVRYIVRWSVLVQPNAPVNRVIYIKDDDLYMSDVKGKNPDRVMRDYLDTVINLVGYDMTGKIIWNDKEEINIIDLRKGKETSFDLDNADTIQTGDIRYSDGLYVYINDDDELCATTNGKKTIVLSKEGEDITSYEIEKGGKQVFWVEDGDLYISPIREGRAKKLVRDIHSFAQSMDGSIYAIADYTENEGGELSLLKGAGQNIRLDKDIFEIIRIHYTKK